MDDKMKEKITSLIALCNTICRNYDECKMENFDDLIQFLSDDVVAFQQELSLENTYFEFDKHDEEE